MHEVQEMPNKKSSDSPSNSVVQPISIKRDLYEKAARAAAMEGLTFAAYVRRLIHQDLVKKGLIVID